MIAPVWQWPAVRSRGQLPILPLLLVATRKAVDIIQGITLAIRDIRWLRWSSAVRSLKLALDPPDSVDSRDFYLRLSRAQRATRETVTLRLNRIVFNAVADPNKIIVIDPNCILHKTRIDVSLYTNDILPGDWDLSRRVLAQAIKHRSIVQHFEHGVNWEDTDVFVDNYARRFARGGSVRGKHDFEELKESYRSGIEALFSDMMENGFVIKVDENGRPISLPHVHIGRDGSFLFGNDGNHRLTIAKMLGLPIIACHVRARHFAWQRIREDIARYGPDKCWDVVDPKFADHPDLADLLGTEERDAVRLRRQRQPSASPRPMARIGHRSSLRS